MDNKDKMPKKNFLSMQLDLSKFEFATDEEKQQQDRMRESTSFLRDGLRRLRKNAVSMICLVIVVILVLVAFIVPLFYPYDYSTSSASTGSYSANYLGPMQYSTKEQILTYDGNTVFLGWSYPLENTLEGYKGLKVIDSEEYLEEVKEYLVSAPIVISDSNTEVYAVWGVDNDGDGVADFGANYCNFNDEDFESGHVKERYSLKYDLNGGSGTAPVDETEYVGGDRVYPAKADGVIAPAGLAFVGWSTKADVPTLTEENYSDYKKQVVTAKVDIENDTTLYAVWGVDADGDGATDGFKISTKNGKDTGVNRYHIYYNTNMGVGEKPVDSNEYAEGDVVVPLRDINFTKDYKYIFPHLLGTDEIGRDYATRVIVGMRISLLVGIIAAVIVVIIGVLYGAISGYFGGRVDLIMMRIVDIIYSLPDTLIIILLSVSLKDVIQNSSFSVVAAKLGGVGLVSILIVFAMLYWVGMARLVRGQVLSLREQEFVLAAKTMGVSPFKVIVKHMLPNCISVIFISAALQIPSAIFTESFLSFLGVGVSIPMPSLGSLASDYRGQMTIAGRGYLFIIPALIIFLIVLSLNLLGQGLRDAFDPKLREVSK